MSELSHEGERLAAEGARRRRVASRRVSEQLIAAGRVTVNGEIVTELGSRVDASIDKVAVDGSAVQLDPDKRYIMLNKPTGVVSTMSDEKGRPDLREFTAEYPERLFNVGRLDSDTSGLLLLTNDGELTHVLAHPSFGVTKTYIATVTGVVFPNVLRKLEAGIELEDGPDRGRPSPTDRRLVARQEHRRADAALRTQSDRAAHARGGRASGGRARAAAVRSAPPRHAGPGARS